MSNTKYTYICFVRHLCTFYYTFDKTFNNYISLKNYFEIIFQDDKSQAILFNFQELFHNSKNIIKETHCDTFIFSLNKSDHQTFWRVISLFCGVTTPFPFIQHISLAFIPFINFVSTRCLIYSSHFIVQLTTDVIMYKMLLHSNFNFNLFVIKAWPTGPCTAVANLGAE